MYYLPPFKRSYPIVCLFVLLSSGWVALAAQVYPTDSLRKGFTVRVSLGYSATRLHGTGRDGFQDFKATFVSDHADGALISSDYRLTHGPRIGLHAIYDLTDRTALKLGFAYQRRGFDRRIDWQRAHPTYQLDHLYTYRERLIVQSVDIPLTLILSPRRNWAFSAGAYFQYSLPGARFELTTEQNVIINREVDEELSTPAVERTVDVADNIRSPLGVLVGVHHNLSDNLTTDLEMQIGGAYGSFDDRKVADFNLSLSISYGIAVGR